MDSDKLRTEISFKLSELPDYEVKEVADFVAFLINKKEKESQKITTNLDYSWVGSLSHINVSALALQEEGKKLWEKLD